MSPCSHPTTPPCSPDLQDDLDTWTNKQMRDTRLFAFNLRLRFTAFDHGELHSNIQDQYWGGRGVITACEG